MLVKMYIIFQSQSGFAHFYFACRLIHFRLTKKHENFHCLSETNMR